MQESYKDLQRFRKPSSEERKQERLWRAIIRPATGSLPPCSSGEPTKAPPLCILCKPPWTESWIFDKADSRREKSRVNGLYLHIAWLFLVISSLRPLKQLPFTLLKKENEEKRVFIFRRLILRGEPRETPLSPSPGSQWKSGGQSTDKYTRKRELGNSSFFKKNRSS